MLHIALSLASLGFPPMEENLHDNVITHTHNYTYTLTHYNVPPSLIILDSPYISYGNTLQPQDYNDNNLGMSFIFYYLVLIRCLKFIQHQLGPFHFFVVFFIQLQFFLATSSNNFVIATQSVRL